MNLYSKVNPLKNPRKTLTSTESELLDKAPLLVCILMAGADGKIDDRELDKAVQLARQPHWVRPVLSGYFQEVSQDFEDKLKILIQSYPFVKDKRNKLIIEELSRVSALWTRLDPDFSAAYYDMLKYLAHNIASSSGRFWARINSDEAALVDLPMITRP